MPNEDLIQENHKAVVDHNQIKQGLAILAKWYGQQEGKIPRAILRCKSNNLLISCGGVTVKLECQPQEDWKQHATVNLNFLLGLSEAFDNYWAPQRETTIIFVKNLISVASFSAQCIWHDISENSIAYPVNSSLVLDVGLSYIYNSEEIAAAGIEALLDESLEKLQETLLAATALLKEFGVTYNDVNDLLDSCIKREFVKLNYSL